MMTPRLDLDEVDYLLNFMQSLPPGTKMVEWGSGGSTAMFVPFFTTGQFVSIEHNEEWFRKVAEELQHGDYDPAALANFTYVFANPPVGKQFYGYGVPYEENPCFANKYINPKIEGVNIWDSDVFFVDGICRGAILATIRMKALKLRREYDVDTGEWSQPATVFIHDYFGPEQREPWYEWASSFYSKVERVGNSLARLHI